MPCYNEEAIVAQTVKRVLSAFERADIRIELVAVDNGSGDQTGEILRQLAAQHPEVLVQRVDANIGYGGTNGGHRSIPAANMAIELFAKAPVPADESRPCGRPTAPPCFSGEEERTPSSPTRSWRPPARLMTCYRSAGRIGNGSNVPLRSPGALCTSCHAVWTQNSWK